MHPKPLRNWDRLDRRELQDMQIRRLRRFLSRQVAPFSAFYRDALKESGFRPQHLRSHADLRHIPFTTKADVVGDSPANAKRFILQPTPELIRSELGKKDQLGLLARRLIGGEAKLKAEMLREYNPIKILFTTGRTAASIPFFLSSFDLEILSETGGRMSDILGMEPQRDRALSFFPFAPHLAFWQVVECATAGGIMTLNTGGGRAMGGERLLGLLGRFGATLLVGMPGYTYHVLRQAREERLDLSTVRLVALGGELVTPEMKRRIAVLLKELGAKDPRVVSVFGFTEARQCWVECPGAADTGFHTSPDLCLMEIIDPDTGEQLGEGETGELVYTTLEGRGSVLLRYRTGDVVEGGITLDPCPGCGRSIPRVACAIRRQSNVKHFDVTKVKGTLVNFNALSELLDSDPMLEEWQLVIRKADDDPLEVDELILHAALADGADEARFRTHIKSRVQMSTEVRLNEVIIETLPALIERIGMETLTKEVRILDLRAEAGLSREPRP